MLFGFAVWDAHRVSISLLSSPVGLIWSLNLQSKAGHIGQVRRACAVWQLSDGGASRHDTAKQAASKSLCFPSFSSLGIRIKSLLPAVLLPWENRQIGPDFLMMVHLLASDLARWVFENSSSSPISPVIHQWDILSEWSDSQVCTGPTLPCCV